LCEENYDYLILWVSECTKTRPSYGIEPDITTSTKTRQKRWETRISLASMQTICVIHGYSFQHRHATTSPCSSTDWNTDKSTQLCMQDFRTNLRSWKHAWHWKCL